MDKDKRELKRTLYLTPILLNVFIVLCFILGTRYDAIGPNKNLNLRLILKISVSTFIMVISLFLIHKNIDKLIENRIKLKIVLLNLLIIISFLCMAAYALSQNY